MELDRIKIKGFKSIREIDIELRSLNVLIGANGAGKSNFIAIFKMLKRMMQGNLQVFVGQSGGADSLLHYGQKASEKMELELKFGLDRYYCELLPTADDNLFFGDEQSYYTERGPNTVNESDLLGSGHKESLLPEEAKISPGSASERVLSNILSWNLYHFHDTSDSARVKKFGAINDNFYLRPDAGNLAAFLYKLQRTAKPQYEAIRDTIRMVAPFFDDFILRPLPENPDHIRLEWRERGSDYPYSR